MEVRLKGMAMQRLLLLFSLLFLLHDLVAYSFHYADNLNGRSLMKLRQQPILSRCLMRESEEKPQVTEDAVSAAMSIEQSSRPIQLINHLHLGPTDYYEVWDQQKELVAKKIASLRSEEDQCPDSVILVEHKPIYTLGTGSTPSHLRFDPETPPPGLRLVRVERGGEVTYHGPGQVVMYPILDLRNWNCDLHWYLRSLEEVIIRALARMGIEGERIDGLTGVWVNGSKVAAIGVKASRWITMHGISLNVDPEMGHYSNIIPCGIDDRPVCAVKRFNPDVSMEEASIHLIEAFQEVFQATITNSKGD